MRSSSVVASVEYPGLILQSRIVIAHRFSAVRTADVILVVEGGRIVERGTHKQLLAGGGRYAELYVTRFRRRDGRGPTIAGVDRSLR